VQSKLNLVGHFEISSAFFGWVRGFCLTFIAREQCFVRVRGRCDRLMY
jgi:hypothetical protein